MPCPFYSISTPVSAIGGRKCPLNFPVSSRPSSPCHMEEEGEKENWDKCSYNNPAIIKFFPPSISALLEETARETA